MCVRNSLDTPFPLSLFSSVWRRPFDYETDNFTYYYRVFSVVFLPTLPPLHHDADNNFRYRIGRQRALRIHVIISIYIRELVRIRKVPFYGSLAKWSSNFAEANEVMILYYYDTVICLSTQLCSVNDMLPFTKPTNETVEMDNNYYYYYLLTNVVFLFSIKPTTVR